MNATPATDYNHPDALEQVALDTLEIAHQDGCREVAAALSAGEGFSVTVRGGDCETLEYERDKSLAVTVYLEGRKGSATTTDFSPEALRQTVTAARQIAENAEADPCAGLADPADLADTCPDLDLDHPWHIEADAAIALALECEAAALGADPRIKQSDGASVNRYQGTRAYANSRGFHGAYRGTRHGISAIMIAADAAGAMQRGYWYASGRNAADFASAEDIGRIAAARTCAKIGAAKIATTELPVIFEPRLAAGLIGHLVSAISGAAQYRKASFLLDGLGTDVLPAGLSLTEQPHLPGAIGSAPFDADGVATKAKSVVRNGRLETYLLGVYAARRLERTPTGNGGGVHNLVLTPGTRTLEEIIAATPSALLVTDLMGFGVNGVTGDYSRGASGFLIRDGAIAQPVEEITIAGNLRDMLLNIQEVGADVDNSLNVRTGSIVLAPLAIAGD